MMPTVRNVNVEFYSLATHELSFRNNGDRLNNCFSHLNTKKMEDFLSYFITGDEKWVPYKNVKRLRDDLLNSWCVIRVYLLETATMQQNPYKGRILFLTIL